MIMYMHICIYIYKCVFIYILHSIQYPLLVGYIFIHPNDSWSRMKEPQTTLGMVPGGWNLGCHQPTADGVACLPLTVDAAHAEGFQVRGR